MGWESRQAITTTSIDGNYMLGDNVLMLYNNDQKVLSPLIATRWSDGGEQPIVACVNSFSEKYRKEVNSNQKFIAMTGGAGGQTIERLSKECSNNGYYQSTFTKILDNTIETIKGRGESVSCPAIIYMQGEYNCDNLSWYTGRGIMPGTNGTTEKNVYKARLLKLKNNMQDDIMQKYGQTKKPLFFIYQTSGGYVKRKEMSIAMAQYEFAFENEDVVLLNPHYAMPDYNGGHLSTNGYRWYGESIAQTLYDVLIKEETFYPVYPEEFRVENNMLTIDYYVPTPPLVLDTLLTPKVTNYGFSVYNNGVAAIINSVKLLDGSQVVLTCSKPLSSNIEVIYAGKDCNGSGNLRDSENRQSLYTYYDDSSNTKKETYIPKKQNGTKIYGDSYPLYNWSIGFYREIDNSQSGLSSLLKNDNLVVFPNPTQDVININNKNRDQEVAIYSYLGQRILTTKENRIDVSSFETGVYFLKVESEITKFIKE